MNDKSTSNQVPPFPPEYRASGILLHVTSLPSRYGIGDVGPAAMKWIDLLRDAGQTWWQSLPLGPTGYGNSPYQPLSSFAASEILISPDWLVEDGLLSVADCASPPPSTTAVNFAEVTSFKRRLLEKAWDAFCSARQLELQHAFEQFCHEQAAWLDDYALFRALKICHGDVCYWEWPRELVQRVPAALADARRKLKSQIRAICFAQFLLFRQGARTKEYGHANGIRMIGDLPFFVSPDSSDVWANPELFLLDERHRPRFVAGVPPDYFSANGQLWGNPLYDWDKLRETGYRWCIDRLRALLVHVDAVRLDHFRAFSAAWHIPAESATAQSGSWEPGPGEDFFFAVERALGGLPLIAEDLGDITTDVYALRDQFHLPGMRVLQFAFDETAENPHRPENYDSNTVVYTGTHDNPPSRCWYEQLSADRRRSVEHYLQSTRGEAADVARQLIRLAWASPASLAIAPLQDVLNLGCEARMNVPGRADDNWKWRASAGMLSGPAYEFLSESTAATGRSSNFSPGDAAARRAESAHA